MAMKKPGLSDEELELCKKAFAAFDRDGACQLAAAGPGSLLQAPADGAERWKGQRPCRRPAADAATAAAPALDASRSMPPPPLLVHHAAAGSGTVDVKELKAVLNSMGQHPTDEELFVMIHDVRAGAACACPQQQHVHTACCTAALQVDEDNSGEIDFSGAAQRRCWLAHSAMTQTAAATAGPPTAQRPCGCR